MIKYKYTLLVTALFCAPTILYSQVNVNTKLKANSKNNITLNSDSIITTTRINEISSSIDTLNSTLKNSSQPNNYTFISTIINVLLFAIALFQFIILRTDRKAYLVGSTFVEQKFVGTSDTTEEFLKNNSNFYLQLTNTGKTAIEEVWIRIPDCMEFNVSIKNSNERVTFKYLNYSEPILPEEKVILFFDDEYFFGENFRLNTTESNIGEIKFRDYRGKIYKKNVSFETTIQKDNVNYNYKLALNNGVTVKDGEIVPLDSSDWDKI